MTSTGDAGASTPIEMGHKPTSIACCFLARSPVIKLTYVRRLACKFPASIGVTTELPGGTNLAQKVKLQLGNEPYRVLAQLSVMMSSRKGVVRLLNPSRLVEQVLELTRLHRVLDIVNWEESLVL